MFSNLRLSARLGLGFGATMLMLALVGGFGLVQLDRLSELNRKLYDHPFIVKGAAQHTNTLVLQMHRILKEAALSQNHGNLEATAAQVDRLAAQVTEEFKVIETRFLGERAQVIQAENAFRRWEPIRREVVDLMKAGQKDRALALIRGASDTQVLAVITTVDQLIDFASHKAVEFRTQTEAAYDKALYLMILVIAAALVLGAVFTVLITRSIVDPMREIAETAEAIAKGDLDREIHYRSRCEIGQMAESLREMLTGVIGEGQSIKNGIAVPLWTVDKDLKLTYLNQRAAELSGRLNGNAGQSPGVGAELNQVLADDEGLLERITRDTLETGQPREAELALGGDRDQRVLLVSTSLLRDLQDRPMGVMAMGVDLTERKRSERERDSLEEQLRQSQKMEAMGTLAGGVAHDFNNLLSAILGYAELSLEDLPPDHPVRSNLEQIHLSGDRARVLVAQLLAFSRKQLFQMRTFRVNDVVIRAKDMFKRIIGEDVELGYHLKDDAGLVHADFHQLEQVLLNLVVNARDAMPGGGRITIETDTVYLDEDYARTHHEARVGMHVMLSVSDNGPGIEPQVRARMFDPFFTTKGPGKGTGLGLATVYGIVKQLGGNIYVYSEPGRGTAMKVYLPRSDAQAGDLPAAEQAPMQRGSERVLVVEDDPMVNEFMSFALGRLGYQVLTAAGGPEALAVAEEQERVDLLLTDVIMPGMSGKELAAALEERWPGLKVVYMSGYTDNVIAHHGALDEGVSFLQKPVSLGELSRMMRRVLDAEA